MAVEKPDLPVFSCKFQEIFNANVFSELQTESKIIFFMAGPLLNRSQAHPGQCHPFSSENSCLYCVKLRWCLNLFDEM